MGTTTKCAHDWHREYEDNPYIDVVYTSLPPKYKWICSKCGEVIYRNCSDGKPGSSS